MLVYDGGAAGMVFNPRSWATHRVSALILCVIDTLRTGPQTREQILGNLLTLSDNEAEIADALDDALREMGSLNLIVQEPASADQGI